MTDLKQEADPAYNMVYWKAIGAREERNRIRAEIDEKIDAAVAAYYRVMAGPNPDPTRPLNRAAMRAAVLAVLEDDQPNTPKKFSESNVAPGKPHKVIRETPQDPRLLTG